MNKLISVIIPLKEINDNIRREVIPALQTQAFQDFELILVPDKYEQQEFFPDFVKVFSSWPQTCPPDKRDFAVKKAKGEIVAFTDDDAYPDKDWLANAAPYFQDEEIAAVCGPGVTPPQDNLKQKVSGWVWSSRLGSGGAGTYRCCQLAKREVDDYPTFNLIIRKSDFEKVGGFSCHFWPGEDTNLCHKLCYELGKKIIYDSNILVYHHRRPIFLPHLAQIGAYGLHRGYFAKILPVTSRRIGYFMPFLFVCYLLVFPFLIWGCKGFRGCREIIFAPITIYLLLLLATAARVYRGTRNLAGSLLLIPAIFSTHLVYGFMFLRGLLSRNLD